MPTVLNTDPSVVGSAVASFFSTALMPRFMFVPWSASPMAESSSVRYSWFSDTAFPKAVIHALASLTEKVSVAMVSPPIVPT